MIVLVIAKYPALYFVVEFVPNLRHHVHKGRVVPHAVELNIGREGDYLVFIAELAYKLKRFSKFNMAEIVGRTESNHP